MKFEELQKSKSYQKILNIIGIFGAIFVFVFALLVSSIGTKEAGAIVIAVLLTLALLWFMLFYVNELIKIKRLAKTFEKYSGKVVNINSTGGRGMVKFVIVFEDYMGEEHRMLSHGIFSQFETPDYMEKELVIYYSKDYPKVLIANITDETEIQDDDPYKL